MATTLLLDTAVWDLVLDASGDIALADQPYSLAQDVASACRTFLSEMIYATNIGVPYLTTILGKQPSVAYVKAQLVTAALTVAGVVNPVAYVTGDVSRQLTGQIQFQTTDGQAITAAF